MKPFDIYLKIKESDTFYTYITTVYCNNEQEANDIADLLSLEYCDY